MTALASLHLTQNSWVTNDANVSRPQLSSVLTQQFYKFQYQSFCSGHLKSSIVVVFFQSLQFPFQIVNFLKIKTVLTNIFLLLSQGSSARNRIYPSVKRSVNTKVPLLLLAVSAQFCVCSRIDISKGHGINYV